MIDYLGFGALLALLLLCAWLTWRARRLRNRAARWAGAGLAGLLTLAVALIFGAAAYGAAQLSRSYPNPAAQLTVARTPERIARGQRLANACAGCHASGGQLPLATGAAYALIRERVPFVERDQVMSELIEAVRRMVAGGELVAAVEFAMR